MPTASAKSHFRPFILLLALPIALPAGTDQRDMPNELETPFGVAEFDIQDHSLRLMLDGEAVYSMSEPAIQGVIVPAGDEILFTIQHRAGFLSWATEVRAYNPKTGNHRKVLFDERLHHFHEINSAGNAIIVESSRPDWEAIKNTIEASELRRSIGILNINTGKITQVAEISGFHSFQGKWAHDDASIIFSGEVVAQGHGLYRWKPEEKLEKFTSKGVTAFQFEPLPDGSVAASLGGRHNGEVLKGLYLIPKPGADPQILDPRVAMSSIDFSAETSELVSSGIQDSKPPVVEMRIRFPFGDYTPPPAPTPLPPRMFSQEINDSVVGTALASNGSVKLQVQTKSTGAETALIEGKKSIELVSTSKSGILLAAVEELDSDERSLYAININKTEARNVWQYLGYKHPDVRWNADGTQAWLKDMRSLVRLDSSTGKISVLSTTQVFEYVPLRGGRAVFHAPAFLRDGKYTNGIFLSNPSDPSNPTLLAEGEVPINMKLDESERTLTYEVRGYPQNLPRTVKINR